MYGLDDLLQQNPEPQQPLPRSYADDLLDLIKEEKKPEPPPTRTMPAAEIATRAIGGLALGAAQGLISLPAGIGALQDKVRMHPAMRMLLTGPQPFLAAQFQKNLIAPAIKDNRAALAAGVITPEKAAELREAGNYIVTGPSAFGPGSEYVTGAITKAVLKDLPSVAAATPDVVGDFVGSLPANMLTYGSARATLGVDLAKTFGGRAVRSLVASTAATAAQSYLIQMRDGESSWMRVVKDLGVNAAFELVGLHGLRNAWKQEAGDAAVTLTKSVMERTGVPEEVAELKITQIRGGGGIHEPAVAETIVNTSKNNPELKSTPIVNEAKKSLSDFWDKIVPRNITVDRNLPLYNGVTMDVFVNGELKVKDYNVPGGDAQFTPKTDAIATRIAELSQQGQAVRLDNIRASNAGTWSRFVTRLRGENARYGKMDSRELSEFEKSLGAAPRGSAAEAGVKPEPGTKVTVTPPDQPRRQAVVSSDQSGTKPAEVRVDNPITGGKDVVLTRNVQAWLYEKKAPVSLAAHSDGTERHFMIDLNSKEAFFEGVDDHDKNLFFRSNEFSSVDKDGGLNNGPRGFIHPDGSITLSVTRGDRLTTYLDGDPLVDYGPLDRLSNKPLRPGGYKTPAERSAHFSGIGSPVQEGAAYQYLEPAGGQNVPRLVKGRVRTDVPGGPEFKMGAGFEPVRAQQDQVQGSPIGKTRTTMISHPTTEVLPPGGVAREEAVGDIEAKMRRKQGGTVASTGAPTTKLKSSFPREEDIAPYDGADEAPGTRYEVGHGLLITDPSLIDARTAARTLLETKNVKGSTPVRLLVTDSIHAHAWENTPKTWTLEDLAHAEPGLFDLPTLRVAAQRRGYRAIPEGEGVLLRDFVTGQDLSFKTRLEASSYLGKQRLSTVVPNLDEGTESLLKIGWLKGFDGELDGGAFTPREAQQTAMEALVQNKRAGVKIWTLADQTEEELINRINAKDEAGVPLRQRNARAYYYLNQDLNSKTGLSQSLREIEKKLGVASGTYGYLRLPEQQGEKQAAVIFNKQAVAELRTKYAGPLENLLQVNTADGRQFLSDLSKREAGLDILQHPSFEDGIIYSYLKTTQQRETMLAGKVVPDQVTGRPYRFYDPKLKSYLLGSHQEQESLDNFRTDVDLKDTHELPPEVNFEGTDPHRPPPLMEGVQEDQTPKGAFADEVSDQPSVSHSVFDWLHTRANRFKLWEAQTGVPFYSVYRLNTDARNAANDMFYPFKRALYNLRTQVPRAGDRANIQLMAELQAAKKWPEVKALRSKMSDYHVAIADQVQNLWTQYLKRAGFDETETQAWFDSFPQLRKKNGDFRAYVGAQQALPKMWSLLRKQMSNEATGIRIDDRETDFFVLGTRLSRSIAYELKLRPAWNDGMKRIEDAVKAVNIPQDVLGNFQDYAHSVLHNPDDMQSALNATSMRFVRGLDGALRKATFGKASLGATLTDNEAIDLMAMFSHLGYQADLLMNPATVIQQTLQLTQTVLPMGGPKVFSRGVRMALRWAKGDPKLREDMALRGISDQPLGTMEEFGATTGAMANPITLRYTQASEAGMKPMHFVDNFTRVAAYMGKHSVVMEEGENYVGKRISWEEFRNRTKLDLQDKANGPVTTEVKELLDRGDIQTAAHRAASDFQLQTNFGYNRGDNPRALDGTVGRYMGRYGNWPLSFASSYWGVLTSSEKMLTKNKVEALATATAANAAMMTAAAAVFGADASRWSIWGSFWYRGSYYLNMGMDAAKVASAFGQGTYDNDPEARLAYGRLKKGIGVHLVPGTQAAKHFYDASQALFAGDIQGAARALAGLPPEAPKW